MTRDGRTSPSVDQGIATDTPPVIGRRIAGALHRVSRGARAMSLLVLALTTGVAAVWSSVAQRQLTASIARESADHLEHARRTFQSTRSRTLDNLRAHARVMVEDPRLKTTLAADGMDELTVADILGDLGKLRRSGFLMVLSAEGRVFAQAGADELRGLDLSDSSAVKKAQGTLEAVVGSWVIGGKLVDLSIMPVRFGPAPIAYLVVGLAVDQDLLNALAEQTGVTMATEAGGAILLSSQPDDALKAVYPVVAGRAEGARWRRIEVDGETYVAAVVDLEQSGPSPPRLVLVQSLAHGTSLFGILQWMILVPPALLLIAVLFAMTANRRVIIVSQAQEALA
jgi:hypothetical protein